MENFIRYRKVGILLVRKSVRGHRRLLMSMVITVQRMLLIVRVVRQRVSAPSRHAAAGRGAP